MRRLPFLYIDCWASGYPDPAMRDFYLNHINCVELIAHTDDSGQDARAEPFICGNHRWTLARQLDEAKEYGHLAIVTLDTAYGNGLRASDVVGNQSAVQFGAFQKDDAGLSPEGYRAAFRSLLGWLPDHVIAVGVKNEQDEPDAVYAETVRLVARERDRRRPDLLIVIGGTMTNVQAAARYADVIDPHLLSRPEPWRECLAFAASFGLPVWPTEMGPSAIAGERISYVDFLREVKNSQLVGALSVFSGNTFESDFPRAGSTFWNGRNHPTFVAKSHPAQTVIGDAWVRVAIRDAEQPPNGIDAEAAIRNVELALKRIKDAKDKDKITGRLAKRFSKPLRRAIGNLTPADAQSDTKPT